MRSTIVKGVLRPTGWIAVAIVAMFAEPVVSSASHLSSSKNTIETASITFVQVTQQNRRSSKQLFDPFLIAVLDDADSYWSSQYIDGLARESIINGFPDGTFRPYESITRAQFATIITKAFNVSVNGNSQPFRDRDSFPSWATQSIDAIARAGLISGFPDGTFRPNQALTRVEAITILTKATEARLVPLSEVESILATFLDNSAIPDWARQQVSTATKDRLIILYPSSKILNPNTLATRGDVAAFLYLALASKGIVPKLSLPRGAEIPKVGANRTTGKIESSPTVWLTPFSEVLNGLGAIIGALGGSGGVLALFNYFRNARQASDPNPSQGFNLGWMITLTFLGFWLALVSIVNLFTLRSQPSVATSNQPSEEIALRDQLQTFQSQLAARDQVFQSQLNQIQQTTNNLETELQRIQASPNPETSFPVPSSTSQDEVSQTPENISSEPVDSNPATTSLFTLNVERTLNNLGLGLLFGAMGGLLLVLPTITGVEVGQVGDLQIYSLLRYLLFLVSLGSIAGVSSALVLVFLLNVDSVLFLALASLINGFIAPFFTRRNSPNR